MKVRTVVKPDLKQILRIAWILLLILGSFPVSVLAQAPTYTVDIRNVEASTAGSGAPVFIEGAVYQVTKIADVLPDSSLVPTNKDMGTITVGPLGAVFTTKETGEYKFVMITRPAGYRISAEEIIISFPKYSNGTLDPDQTYKIFVKMTLVLGDVELSKSGVNGQALAGAYFTLWQKTAPGQTGITLPRQMGTVYVTDATGKILVENLPEGDYEFVEAQAPAGFILDNTPIPFTITPNTPEAIFVKVNKVNHKVPAIVKKINDGNFYKIINPTDNHTFTLTVEIPRDIASYKTFEVHDKIDPRLVIVSYDGKGSTVEVTPQNEIIFRFSPASLAPFAGSQLTLSIVVKLKDPASGSVDIPNTAEIWLDNSKGTVRDGDNPIHSNEVIINHDPTPPASTPAPTTAYTPKPTQPGTIKLPDTGSYSDYYFIGAGLIFLAIFFWLANKERKEATREK